MKTVIFSVLMLILALPENPALAQEEYVYSVRITKGSKRYVQTGFQMTGTTGIITALHGVVGADRIGAVNKEAKTFTGLNIVRVDIDHDLALLSNTKLESERDEGFTKSDSDPHSRQRVGVWGHPAGIEFKKKEDVYIGNPPRQILSDFIEDRYARAFDERRSPDTEAEVLYLEGNMISGHSGAPVIDLDDKSVLGIVNGGIWQGAAAISWAIPVQNIKWRRTSSAKQRLDDLARLDRESPLYALQEDPDYSLMDAFKATFLSAVVRVEGQSSCGTGFFVRTYDGSVKIITASHVLGSEKMSVVRGMDTNGVPREINAIVERTKYLDTDLALLNVNLSGWSVTPLTLGNIQDLDQELTGVGYGGEHRNQCSDNPGFRTAKVVNRYNETLELSSPTQGQETSIRHGDSGGPLFYVNDNGDFVVVAMIQGGAPGVGPATAIASPLLQQLSQETNITNASSFYDGVISWGSKRRSISSAMWCRDPLTLCWRDRGPWFNGSRLLVEPNSGFHRNNVGANEVINQEELFQPMDLRSYRYGLEFNVFRALASIQVAFSFPEEIELYEDPDPTVGKNPALRVLKDQTDNRIKVSFAYEVGVSLLDGIFSIGAGTFRYQDKEFREDRYNSALRDRFFYLNFQPIMLIRRTLRKSNASSLN